MDLFKILESVIEKEIDDVEYFSGDFEDYDKQIANNRIESLKDELRNIKINYM